MPVLDIIRRNSCTDTVIVVTRYFGGTLLGTGGLVHAYSAAALGALQSAEIIRYDIYTKLQISVSYSDYGKITAILSDLGFRTEETNYDTGVCVVGSIIKTNLAELDKKLTEATSARAVVEILGEDFSY
jgi:putative IMPACT (imprinted ancient) family translation regulator